MYTWRCIWSSVVQASAVSWMHHFIELFTVLEDNWTKIKYFDCFSVFCYGWHRCGWEVCCMHGVLSVLTPGPVPETVKGVFGLALCWMTYLYKLIKLILQPVETSKLFLWNFVQFEDATWFDIFWTRVGEVGTDNACTKLPKLAPFFCFWSGPIVASAAQSRAEYLLSKAKAKHDQAWSPSGWVIVLC